jgi:lipopolysaccharide transport protein LptA
MSRSAQYVNGLLALFFLPASVSAQGVTTNGLDVFCRTLSGNAGAETVCEGFKFDDGSTAVSAGLAATNKTASDNSLWRLTDGVQLGSGMAEILAEEALLRFEADELVLIELSGSPIVMSDYIAERETAVSGRAQGMSYDVRSGEVRLAGQATLKIGENEVSGCEWVYNVIDKTWGTGAAEECDTGIRLLFVPPEESDDPEVQPETP